ncbi:MAG: peptidylprolyl isomerase [Candidatus Thiodiazotropha sp.]
MNPTQLLKTGLLTLALSLASPCHAVAQAEVLVSVGPLQVTATDLESALSSFPFADRVPGMDEQDQAALRGDMLQRLVASRLLSLEAKRLGLDEDPAYLKELEDFRLGLLYRHYMDRLREKLSLNESVEADMRAQFAGDPEGLAAARSAYLAEEYRALRYHTIQSLRERYHIEVYEGRIRTGGATPPETVLLQGDGLRIRYAELIANQPKPPSNPAWVREQLYKRAELITVARAAEESGVDVSDKLASYARERLPALLMERRQREWTADEQALQAYYAAHPQIGRIEERRHIGQLVSATRDEAESLRERIEQGESLFELAAQYSIDPYGRERQGDMGWQVEGRGYPALEQVLAELQDHEVSPVVETPMGFHLVTILERRPGGQKTYRAVQDRVAQLWIGQQLSGYMNELSERYQVVWHLMDQVDAP